MKKMILISGGLMILLSGITSCKKDYFMQMFKNVYQW